VAVPAAQNLLTAVNARVTELLALGKYTEAAALVQQTIQQITASPVANNAALQTVLASLNTLQQSVVSKITPAQAPTAATAATQEQQQQASTAQAQAQAQIQQFVDQLNSPLVPVSSAAATSMANQITPQVQALISSGSYSTAKTLVIQSLNQIRSSAAFAANDPATLAIVQQLVALGKTVETSDPSFAASAAQASAAQASYVSALQSTEPATSIAAAKSLSDLVTAEISEMIALGQYSQAAALIQQTIQQIKGSPSASNASVTSMIASLTNLQETVVSKDPATINQASAAQAYYTTALKETDVAKSVEAAKGIVENITQTVNKMLDSGSPSSALSLVSQTLQLIYSSSAYAAGDPTVMKYVSDLVALGKKANEKIPPENKPDAVAATAQTQLSSSIQNGSVQESSAAVVRLTGLVVTGVNSLIATGAYSNASNILTQVITLIQGSSAYKAQDSACMYAIDMLKTLMNNATKMSAPPPQPQAQAVATGPIEAPTENIEESAPPSNDYGRGNYGDYGDYGPPAPPAQEGGKRKITRRSKSRKSANKTPRKRLTK
jgi:Arc/MetJ-type ribon-helix-helix transcriptional regulator